MEAERRLRPYVAPPIDPVTRTFTPTEAPEDRVAQAPETDRPEATSADTGGWDPLSQDWPWQQQAATNRPTRWVDASSSSRGETQPDLGSDPTETVPAASADDRQAPAPQDSEAEPGASAAQESAAVVTPETVTLPALLEEPTKAESFRASRPGSGRRFLGRTLSFVWTMVTLAAFGAVLTGWLPLDVPEWLPTAGAVAMTSVYAYGLAARTGGRPWVSGGLALGLAATAVVTQLPVLVAGVAVVTAVLAAVLGVMATKPAARFSGVIRECLLAIAIAVAGAFAVEAYDPQVSVERISYLALGLSLLGALGLVYRLGAGLQGLGKRGGITIVSAVVLLGVALAYTEALSRWGSPGMIDSIEQTVDDLRATFRAVPRPIEVLLGFPALAWGVYTRARRRQGWWVSAFGAAGLAAVAVSLLDTTQSVPEIGLSLVYSIVLGLLLGYLVIRTDKFVTGTRGRRARALEEASAHRPEPGRMRPLL